MDDLLGKSYKQIFSLLVKMGWNKFWNDFKDWSSEVNIFRPEGRLSLDKIIANEVHLITGSFDTLPSRNELDNNLKSMLLEGLSEHMRKDSSYISLSQYFTDLNVEKEKSKYYNRISNPGGLYVPQVLTSIAEERISKRLIGIHPEFFYTIFKPLGNLVYIARLIIEEFNVTFRDQDYHKPRHPFEVMRYNAQQKSENPELIDEDEGRQVRESEAKSILEKYYTYRRHFAFDRIGYGYPSGAYDIFNKPKDFLKPKNMTPKT